MANRKLFTYLTVLILSLFLISCSRNVQTYEEVPAKRASYAAPHYLPKSVVGLTVEGNINVKLHRNPRNSKFFFTGQPSDLSHLKHEIKGDHLRVFFDKKGYPRAGPVTLNIYLPYLSMLNYRGTGEIVGRDLASKQLSLSIYNHGRTTLEGNLKLKEIAVGGRGEVKLTGIQSHFLSLNVEDKAKLKLIGGIHLARIALQGDAWLSLYWVKSNNLYIRLKDKAYVQLAGVVSKLDVSLWDKAHLNAKYLQAEHGFVKTHQQSTAEVSISLRQHTVAKDASDIYFYNMPELKADFMSCNGAVLDFLDWDSHRSYDYTRYNK